MTVIQEQAMGRFSVEVDLANNDDRVLAEAGYIAADKVRRVRVRGVVDSGAARLVIPRTVADQLGLPTTESVQVRFADNRVVDRGVVRDIHLTYGGRAGVFTAIVEPNRESALIGAIVLEDLDFLIDCVGQRLVPRNPNFIVAEIESIEAGADGREIDN